MSQNGKKKAVPETESEETVESAPIEEAELAEEALPAEESPASEAEKFKAEAERFHEQAEDFKRKWYSVTAEYENYRKRTASTRAQAYAEGRADVIKGLFPIADNLERALESCAEEQTRKGVEMILKSFHKLLEEEEVEEICPLGEEFNPEKCEAVLAVDAEEGEESGLVKHVFRKGYERKGKVLRFAQVSVTK